ncbi:MAG: hypothetical protein ACTSRU_21710, partial [Candidatus Hodarchaeales archaeon]
CCGFVFGGDDRMVKFGEIMVVIIITGIFFFFLILPGLPNYDLGKKLGYEFCRGESRCYTNVSECYMKSYCVGLFDCSYVELQCHNRKDKEGVLNRYGFSDCHTDGMFLPNRLLCDDGDRICRVSYGVLKNCYKKKELLFS